MRQTGIYATTPARVNGQRQTAKLSRSLRSPFDAKRVEAPNHAQSKPNGVPHDCGVLARPIHLAMATARAA
eukprot:2611282-Lingulodinium_polyedra.AAC.1